MSIQPSIFLRRQADHRRPAIPFGGNAIGRMMLDGIRSLVPTGVMLMLAILYFGVMIDAGLFDPVARRILAIAGDDPLKILIGTAIHAALVSRDSDGSTTYMITVASMLPLYRRLGMNPLNLTCVTMLAGGVMNLTPWGEPLARAANALHLDPGSVFIPMLPTMAVGVIAVVGLAYVLGLHERRRVGTVFVPGEHERSLVGATPTSVPDTGDLGLDGTDGAQYLLRSRLLWFNAIDAGSLHDWTGDRAGRERSDGAAATGAHRGSCEECHRGRIAHLRRRRVHRHPVGHQHGRCDVQEFPDTHPARLGTVDGADRRHHQDAVHVLRVKRYL